MPEIIPKGPFDQGLFLAHLNKGREFYESRHFQEAESELEEAYLLRPRDLNVLNLLGLVYFKGEKFDKAEEVYRKLVAESPDAHTLHYNLGLISFKLGRLDDAEISFLKALELSRENPKISFYLGSIYERLHRFKDAIFQYRQAGASIMVRQLEDKLAKASDPTAPSVPPVPSTPPIPRDHVTVDPSRGRVDPAKGHPSDGDFTAKRVEPLGSAVLTTHSTGLTDTARFKGPRREDDTLPPGARRSPAAAPQAAPVVVDTFRCLENNLLESSFQGKLYIKQGTLHSYSGTLTFWVKERRSPARGTLVIVTGNGRLILTDKDREITLMRIEAGPLFVESGHLMACEEGLTPRYVALGEDAGPDVLVLEGHGALALSVHSRPLPIEVTPDLPVCLPLPSVITWTSGLTAELVLDQEVYAVAALPDGLGGPLVRLRGSGRVLVEQMAP